MTAPATDPTNYGNLPGDGPLRPNGVSLPAVPLTEDDLPSTESEAVKKQKAALQIVRDCAAGPQVIRAAEQTYLPKDIGEKAPAYRNRLNRSVFFNVFGETITALTGFVFSKDPVLGDDVPAPVKDQWENIDNAGTHGDVFVRELFQDALTAGHAGILVDFPAVDGGQLPTQELGAMAPIRPYWVPICKDDIVSWRTTKIDGRTVLTQIVFRECSVVPSGAFGEKEQTQYRVLYMDPAGAIRGKLLQVNPDQKTVTVVGEWVYPTQTEIPFAEIPTSGTTSFLESKPPLLDLAYLNIAHYQLWSDRAVSLHMTCVPIWVETGIDPDPQGDGPKQAIVIGPSSARRFSNPAAKAGYQSHSGAALSEVTKVIDELKTDMAVLGVRMISPEARQQRTAAASRIDKSATDSKLAVAARGLQDGVERALGFHANYLKRYITDGSTGGGSIQINREFESTQMAPEMLLAYVSAVSNAGLPVRVLLEAMQDGGLLEPDADLDALEAEVAANQQAAADQKALEAANKLATAASMTNKTPTKVAA